MIAKIFRLAKSIFVPAYWRAVIAGRAAKNFDRRYGTDTLVKKPISEMHGIEAGLAAHAVDYEVTAIPKFKRVMKILEKAIGERLGEFAFVDIGSGKGLVVMRAAVWPLRQVLGIEMSPELHRIAEDNLKKYQSRKPVLAPCDLVVGNALACPWPSGCVVFYLYNPFDGHMVRRFLDRLERLYSSGDRVYIAYVNPVHRDVFHSSDRCLQIHADSTLEVYAWTNEEGERVIA